MLFPDIPKLATMDEDTAPSTSAAALESSAPGPVTRNGPTAPLPAAARPKAVKPDHTILKPPITTSVTGMKQAIFALENSTPEVSLL